MKRRFSRKAFINDMKGKIPEHLLEDMEWAKKYDGEPKEKLIDDGYQCHDDWTI